MHSVGSSIPAGNQNIAETLSPETPGRALRCGVLETDDDGLYFDSTFRAHLSRGRRMEPEALLSAEAFRAMSIAAKALSGAFEEVLEKHGITYPQFGTMKWLRDSGTEGTQLNQIAAWLGRTPRTVTGLVDGLEALGLVERVPDPTDRRAVIARLTSKGEQVAEAATRAHQAGFRQLMGTLSDEEKRQLRHISLKLLAAADDMAEKKRNVRG
jgi:DNA-binding MarR family transcriptional regulator